jgi:hypothetical protein
VIVPRQHQWHRFDVVILEVFWSHHSDEGTKMRPKHSGHSKTSAERVMKDIRRATRRHFSVEKKIWVLDFGADVEVPQTKSIIIEGTQAGFDRISVEWAASSSDD